MNKSKLAEKMIQKMREEKMLTDSLKPKIFYQVITFFFDQIRESIRSGEKVEVRGVGTFTKKKYRSYVARNPATGEKVVVPAKDFPIFHPSRKLIDYLNDGKLTPRKKQKKP